MSDLVSRQKVIEVIDAVMPVDPNKSEYASGIACGAALAMTYVKQLPSAQPETNCSEIPNNWIPCSERLPELDGDGYSDKVLVCFSNYSGSEICEYRKNNEYDGWYAGDSDDNPEDIGVHVTAWMPLPEPYKERREE